MASSISALLKRSTIDDHEEVLKACNLALKQAKGDLEAQHAKTVALLKLERYDDALRVFEEGGDRLKSKGQLAFAYTLYKAGELEQAEKVAGSIDTRGARHLEAQASYRLENFANARNLYEELLRDAKNEESDLRINGSATDAQLEWKRQGDLVRNKKAQREDLEAFETAYNAACGCVARGELAQAGVLLQRAKGKSQASNDLCNASEELSDDDKKAELLPILIQQLYIFSSTGKTEQAEAVAAEIDPNEVPDQSTRQIGQINTLTASNQPSNQYLSHRIFHSLPPLPKNDRFFTFQNDLFTQDETTLDLMVHKYGGVIKSTTRRLSEDSSPTTSATINSASAANAAAHAQNQLGKLGIKSILPLLEKRSKDVGLVATIVQLYVLTKNHGAAIQIMEKFLQRLDETKVEADQDVRFAPGLVAMLVSLYSIEGRKSHIRTELAKAASYWRHKSKGSSKLLRAAGFTLLESGNAQELENAGEIFDGLHKQDPSDRFANAGLVAAYAITNPSRLTHETEQLTAINRLAAGVDIKALESAGMPQVVQNASSVLSRKRAATENAKPPKKRMRKARLPKDYDPNKKPDSERWLPLRDRSTYRPKGKKGKQKQAALTQGGVNEKVAENLSVDKPKAGVIGGKSKKKNKKK